MQCTFITEMLSDNETESPDGALVSASTHALLDPFALSAAEGSVCGVRRAHVPSPDRRWDRKWRSKTPEVTEVALMRPNRISELRWIDGDGVVM